MAIGVPVALGNNNAASGSTTLAITTTADAPAGGLIVVLVATSTSSITAASTCADSAGNTYFGDTLVNNGTGKSRLYWSFNTLDLPIGGTITHTYSNSAGVKNMTAVAVAGCSAVNLQGAGALGTSTLPTIATGVLGWPNEIIFGTDQITAGSADSYTEAAGFTALVPSLNSDALRWAYQIVTANSTVTYAPTLGTSRTWGVNTVTFSGAVASPFNRATQFSYLEF